MKQYNELRIALMARRDTIHGGAGALVIAKRVTAITGSSAAEDIVTDVYTGSKRIKFQDCRECGSPHWNAEQLAQCCAPNDEEE